MNVDIEDVNTWPPGAVIRYNSTAMTPRPEFDRIDHLGIVVSNTNDSIVVWWPRGRQAICTYTSTLGRIAFNKKVISRFL